MVSPASEKSATRGKKDRPRNVLLLPSHLFFVRSVPLPAGISPEEIPSFVELSLEEISPFALNQLYYGYYLPPGSGRVLVFAAYRKQLAAYEEDPSWISADLVLPDFTAALGIEREGPTVAFLQDRESLTALYWADDDTVPERVISRHLGPAEGDLQVEKVREELRRRLGALPEKVTTVVLAGPEADIRDRNLAFDLRRPGESAEVAAEISRGVSLPMDVRDKAFLQATRKEQRQNRWLWAGVMAVCAGFIALIILEAALFAGGYILNTREGDIRALEPEVARIRQEEDLANRLEELSGERLLPFEMLAFLNQYRPPSIYFTRAVANGLRSFEIDARTPRSQDVDRFQRLLENDRSLEDVEIRNLRLRAQDGLSSFTLVGSFREGALRSFSPERPVTEPSADPGAVDEEPAESEFAGEEEIETDSIPEVPAGELPEGEIQLPLRPDGPEGEAPGPMPEEPLVEGAEVPVREEALPIPAMPAPPEPDGEPDAGAPHEEEER